MRNLSCQLTTAQILDGSKTVTRRLGWRDLKRGDLLQAIEKGQGLKKGEKVKRLRVIRVKSVRFELLGKMAKYPDYGRRECIREGFPDLTPPEFIAMFCASHRSTTGPCTPRTEVTRIEFEYVS